MASLCSALQGVPIGWPDWPTHVSHPELGLPAHWLVVERETLQRLQRVGSSWHLRWCKSPRLGGWNPMTSKLVNKKLLTGDPKKTASFFFLCLKLIDICDIGHHWLTKMESSIPKKSQHASHSWVRLGRPCTTHAAPTSLKIIQACGKSINWTVWKKLGDGHGLLLMSTPD